ncbi:30S ribosomal protein S12 methylthiotransferase RimO [Muricomes intestini]|mgnify:CR=1 FL=1|jgi:ribosomal protein S12 methylthiotransferase|uniref:30S ribosomal protein S12 methylthiotransferase RimO n=1 Tax=Muricomes intestini TaxID=1796634 RepID=UPI000E82A2DE|nr:30S ribosomal protein S12 methylthiotransferase RimO [Lachnospiraceae bacterium]HCR82902.1 30S ribosomal protein S12 methylthiotransferase RimO [Lachnospiraceae bacterium]
MKILFISLGCDKNLVDSEVMLGLLASRGYEMTDEETKADIIVVNTCCFIRDAKEESIQNILEMARYKKEGHLKALIVTGCMAQRYRQEVLDEISEVDAVLGTASYDKILDVIDEALKGHHSVTMEDMNALPEVPTKRLVTTGGHFAYLKIAEGCDKHCTYCIIPKIRGNFRSVPMEELLEEAGYLAEQGVRELILVAQETTLYGKDIYGKKSLHLLLKELCKINSIRWIRVMYCYPEEITDELIEVMKEEEKVCHYLDLPIQHANDTILKRMGRRTSKQKLITVIGKLRKEIPDICLRTTLITGFPGETNEQHEELMGFVDEMEFDRLGVFIYSPEEDTPAAAMPDQIEEEIKEKRQAELMELQQNIAFEKAENMIGQEVLVMIEGKVADENAYVGRTYRDAPNVDGLIFVNTEEELNSGDFAKVKVSGAADYDLIGGLI